MRKNIYTANKSYTPTFQAIEATSNIEILKHILNESFELYCKMKPKHQYNNKIKNMHWNMSCEKAALYLRQHRIYRKNIGFKRKTPDKYAECDRDILFLGNH